MQQSRPKMLNPLEFPDTKGHVLRSAAASIFDGKPPRLMSNNLDIMSTNMNGDLITDTKLIKVNENPFVPDFNKIENIDESENLDIGVASGTIARDREFYEEADRAI